MSKNLQKMMASKYPTPTPIIMKDSVPVDHTPSKQFILTSKKMILLAVLLAGLFFLLALPHTFKTVGAFFPDLNSVSSVDPKLVALHALVFAVVAFLIFRML